MVKLSVIVPCYNVEKYLSECLDSILNQTFEDIEIICINDGSTDNTQDILDSYLKKDKRIKVISQHNQGLSMARNVGLKNVTGEYVTFIDSDDYFELTAFEETLKIVEEKSLDLLIFKLINFDADTFEGERELFQMQIELAKKLNLPVIVHSRDAFEDTLDCIKNMRYDRGIIHCFSYGIDEARAFLDRGWYLAFGGAVTYTKKNKLYEMEELLRFVPDDRLLLETDAPYLAPVPLRGETNTPLNIHYTYEFISAKRNITTQQLCRIVDKNCEKLFKLS